MEGLADLSMQCLKAVCIVSGLEETIIIPHACLVPVRNIYTLKSACIEMHCTLSKKIQPISVVNLREKKNGFDFDLIFINV